MTAGTKAPPRCCLVHVNVRLLASAWQLHGLSLCDFMSHLQLSARRPFHERLALPGEIHTLSRVKPETGHFSRLGGEIGREGGNCSRRLHTDELGLGTLPIKSLNKGQETWRSPAGVHYTGWLGFQPGTTFDNHPTLQHQIEAALPANVINLLIPLSWQFPGNTAELFSAEGRSDYGSKQMGTLSSLCCHADLLFSPLGLRPRELRSQTPTLPPNSTTNNQEATAERSQLSQINEKLGYLATSL